LLGDPNGDGRDDIIFPDAGCIVVEWLMNGPQLAAPPAVMAPMRSTTPSPRFTSSDPKPGAHHVAGNTDIDSGSWQDETLLGWSC